MKKNFYAILMAFLVLSSVTFAQLNVVYVSQTPENDQEVVDAINGYDNGSTFAVTMQDVNFVSEDIAIINAADVVVMGRSVSSGTINDGVGYTFWDEVTAPVFYNSPWVVRGDRAGMVTAGNSVNNTGTEFEDAVVQANILDASNPIFEGITGTTIDWWTGTYSILDPETGTINGKVLAQTAEGQILLSMYEAGVQFSDDADEAHTPVAARAYMGLGEDKSSPAKFYNFSDDAKLIYMRVLKTLADGATATNKITAAQAELKVYATTNMVSISMIDLNRIEVYSLDGKMMLSSNANSNQLELTASLNNGIYIIRAFNSKGTNATQKFIVR